MSHYARAVGWSDLRALRASPPGLAGCDDERRAVFVAALEQAEQFLVAASGNAYATKPVQLFYALSQSGRAICAACAAERWRIHGHGATVETATPVALTTVEPKKGALTVVARATGSEVWDGPVNLGQLWASLPELHERPLDPDAVRCQPLERDLDSSGAEVLPHPLQVLSSRAGLRIDVRPGEDSQERAGRIRQVLARYPRAAGAEAYASVPISATQGLLWLTWIREENGQRVVTAPESLTESSHGQLYLRPGLGTNAAVPSLLVTWWGVLLALSSLARYEPVVWREALDVDRSPTGHALETALNAAESRLPALVLDAITASAS